MLTSLPFSLSTVPRWRGGVPVRPRLPECWTLPVLVVSVWKVWFSIKIMHPKGAAISAWRDALDALQQLRWAPTMWSLQCLGWRLAQTTSQHDNNCSLRASAIYIFLKVWCLGRLRQQWRLDLVLFGSQSELSRLPPSPRDSQTLSSVPVQGGVALLEGFQSTPAPFSGE